MRPEEAPPPAPNSLFGEILDWMLAPLLLLWPISVAMTNHVANGIADLPYDQALAEKVVALAKLVRQDDGRVSVNLPRAARVLLHNDAVDATWFQLRGPDGKLLAGDEAIPPPPSGQDEARIGEVRLYDAAIQGEAVRVAYRRIGDASVAVLVQVAETRRKREALSSRIISGVLLPQFAIIPLAAALVWLGLSRGLAPIGRLRALIHQRRMGDLSPIDTRDVPEELRPMTLAFNEMLQRLLDYQQAQQRFIADAAHQMRTPLTGLKTQAELALGERDPEQLRRSLQQIARSVDSVARLINQLLMLARAEANQESPTLAGAVDLVALAREETQDWVPRALAKTIDLGFECAAPACVAGNALLLREVLRNLIDNAIKYTPAGGRVTVRVKGGEAPTIEVEDDGIGIAEAERERVFERFYRALDTGVEGSGLGLPICREIAEAHGAKIVLDSGEGGRGTRVAVVFAAEAADQVMTRNSIASPSSPV